MAETINLGIVGIKNMGEYDPEIEYEKLNVVTYQGSTYCALKNTVGNLPTSSEYWQLYAEKGGKGDTGPEGPRGPQGPKGDPGSAPLAVSSINDMADTSKIYVLTTDGNWYYYDGTSWVSGGAYQVTQFTEDEIKPFQEEIIEKHNLFPYNEWIGGKTIQASDGRVVNFATGSYCPRHISLEPLEKYVFVCMESYYGKSMRIACYDENDAYIESVSCYIQTGYDCSVNIPENTSYGIVHSYNLNFDNFYPSDYPYLVKFDDLDSLVEWTKPMYLKTNFQMINNSNVYCQDKIEWSISNGITTQLGAVFTKMINRYTQHVNKTISANSYPFFTFYMKNPTVGDKIRIKFTEKDEHITSVGLYPYAGQSANVNFTYNEDADEYVITLTDDIINNYFNNGHARICTRITGISSSTDISFTMQINANNYCNNFDDLIKKIDDKDEEKTYKGMFLGDSITALTGDRSWINYFSQIIPLSNITNVAVAGATLMDKNNTVYDGNPVYAGPDNNENNVLGNQVQKILNNNYDTPDFILIAIGTNGGITFTNEQEIYNVYWNDDGTVRDLDTVDRKTSAGAFRYCNEKLHELYPNAMIVWCTPIQAYTKSKNVKSTIEYGNNLKTLCSYGSNYYIDTEKCGINGINEVYGGNGEDLLDGLHPNVHGAKKMGTFNACEFKKFLDRIDLY